jgi:hypothetical protein
MAKAILNGGSRTPKQSRRSNMWRIKHKPSGMYYIPASGTTKDGICITTNLNKNGKVYTRKPKVENILSHGFHNHLIAVPQTNSILGWTHFARDAGWTKFDPKDWEVERV